MINIGDKNCRMISAISVVFVTVVARSHRLLVGSYIDEAGLSSVVDVCCSTGR